MRQGTSGTNSCASHFLREVVIELKTESGTTEPSALGPIVLNTTSRPTHQKLPEILGENVYCGLLGSDAVWYCRWLSTFRNNEFFPSSGSNILLSTLLSNTISVLS
jgi:hypothetical protein